MIRIQSILLCSALACEVACGVAAAAVDEVRVEGGSLKGAVAGGVVAFKGIPYAAPPTGGNRWRAPQPVTPWKGVRPAAAYGSDCMQLPFPGDAAPLGNKPAEDCLYLNVWAPVERHSGKLPVMVWIYGGGFVNGGTSPAVYDGTHFAERGVVLVSFNYRVGRFGFFAFPSLTKEDPNGLLGNYCFMDQIAALEWVRKNIAQFGGDAAQRDAVRRIRGRRFRAHHDDIAAGARPVPEGHHRIRWRAQLARDRCARIHESAPNLPSGEAVGVAFAEKAGIKGEDAAALAALRALPAERVVDGLNMASMMTPTYSRSHDRWQDRGGESRAGDAGRPRNENSSHRGSQQQRHRILFRQEHG